MRRFKFRKLFLTSLRNMKISIEKLSTHARVQIVTRDYDKENPGAKSPSCVTPNYGCVSLYSLHKFSSFVHLRTDDIYLLLK